jgi:hypothetical protein
MRPTPALVFGLVVALLGLGAVTRLPSLDADPPLLKSVDELSDEGYWSHNASAAVLFGTPFPDDLAQGPTAAPLFHWTPRAVFQTLGVSYTSLRLPSALAGTLLAPVVFLLALPSLGLRAAIVAGTSARSPPAWCSG